MAFGEVGSLAPLADDDDIRVRFKFEHGFHQIAVAQLGFDVLDTRRLEAGLGIFQQQTAALLRDLGFLG